MNRGHHPIIGVAALVVWTACAAPPPEEPEPTPTPLPPPVSLEELMDPQDQLRCRRLRVAMQRLDPLRVELEQPRPGDWLAMHFESGQTFDQYLGRGPVLARGQRHVICVQPLGDFAPAHRTILDLTVQFLGAFFGTPVRVLEEVPISVVPQEAQRQHPDWGDRQVLTTWVLYELLVPRLSDDAAALIALTAADLWPGKDWNFVFGQASTRHRVAVWSMYRNGDPDAGELAFRLCLLRTLKTAAHEIAHIFGLAHEQRSNCLMNGSNHREESDRQPLWLCPRSVAKVCFSTGADPLDRYSALATFCAANGLREEAAYYRGAVELLREGGWPPLESDLPAIAP